MDNIDELLSKLNTEFNVINNDFDNFLEESNVKVSAYSSFLKNINALDTSSLDADKTVTIMTGENDKQTKMINSIPVIDEVEDPIKDDQVKNPIINLNGEV